MYQVTRKNYLARNLNKMSRAFPNDYKFFPKTWLIPQEASDFRNQFLDSKGQPLKTKKTYIVKPEGLSQGQGIYLSRNCEKIIEQCSAEGGFIVQDYIDKPHLIDDLKYDLRIYVLLYGINPMRVYVHE
jgi:tubulin polyglutamylase TTLL6/13|tara:strand:- start:597 stop:983 length:387 start_codon:yes stop_codon:yes gene_type:complete